MPFPNTDLSEAITYCNRKVKGTSLVRIFGTRCLAVIIVRCLSSRNRFHNRFPVIFRLTINRL